MGTQKFSAFKLADSELIAALRSITADVPVLVRSYSFDLSEQGQSLVVKADEMDSSPILQQIIAADAAILHRASWSGPHYTVSVERGIGPDTVTANFPDQPQAPEQNVRFLALVHKHLRAYGRTAATEEVLGHELAEFYRQREDLLTRLEALNTKVIESNEQYRLRLEQETDALRQRQQAAYEARLEELSAEFKRSDDELKERGAALATRG